MAKKINWKIRQAKKVRCPWCGKLVGISSSRNLLSHVVSKGIKCVGIGQPVDTIKEYWEWKSQQDNMKIWRELFKPEKK